MLNPWRKTGEPFDRNGSPACLKLCFSVNIDIGYPAVGILETAPLQTGQHVVELHGQLADAVVYGLIADVDMLVAVRELANGGNYGGGAGAEGLAEPAAFAGLEQLVHGERTLLDLNAHLAGEGHDAAASDAGQDGVLKGSGNELAEITNIMFIAPTS